VTYQKKVLENASMLAQELKENGFRLMTGGTGTHLIMVDLAGSGIRGEDAQTTLDSAGIILNGNDVSAPQAGQIGSSLRMGTPAVTSRGFGKEEINWLPALLRKYLPVREMRMWKRKYGSRW
jgi:glycine hydroxymethyltransferase